MSKSFDNYIGVTEAPSEMYGKTLSIPDTSLQSWYELLLGSEVPAGLGPRDAKRALARSLVKRFHGADAAVQAEAAFDRQFIRHEQPEDVPSVDWPRGEGQVHVPALLSRAFSISTSEARRSIAQGGVRIDGQPLADDSLDLDVEALDGKVIQLGKRRFARVQVT